MNTQQELTSNDNRIRILILGENNAGKTSLVDILIRRDVPQVPWSEVGKTYKDPEQEPVTYITDKYVITDTRGLEASITRKERKEDQRAYMERIKHGFNIVLVVFNSAAYDVSDPKVIPTNKVLFPELANIMHPVFKAWELRTQTDEMLMKWVGTKDVLKLQMPSFESDLTPELHEIYRQHRFESLSLLENCIFSIVPMPIVFHLFLTVKVIQKNASKNLHKLSPEVGAQLRRRLAPAMEVRKRTLFRSVLPWLTCIGALGLFVYFVRKIK